MVSTNDTLQVCANGATAEQVEMLSNVAAVQMSVCIFYTVFYIALKKPTCLNVLCILRECFLYF